MKIGNLVRAFDFPSTDCCYMEGRIIEIDTLNNLLTIETTKKVFNGEESEFGEQFKTPVLGSAASDDMVRYNEGEPSEFKTRIVVLGE